jgi:hypothetical protein
VSDVVVSLSLATICFLNQCHPALVGAETPLGSFPMQQAHITAPGYGGDVVLFTRRKRDQLHLAVHRVYLLKPAQRRAERLRSPLPSDRRGVTDGCVNVEPQVYDAMPKAGTLTVVP